jgi:hypothetical protein
MGFQLSDVVPWGRSFDEYVGMFGLTATDLQGRILGCGDGPASFNAVATERGYRVTSADPLYVFTADQIRRRIEETASSSSTAPSAFHLESIGELTRVAREVRIFPLLELGSVVSRHLAEAVDVLTREGCGVQRVRVDYELQKGGNEMLRIARRRPRRAAF